MIEFIKNAIMPLNKVVVSEEDNVITITANDTKTRGLLIGRESSNLKRLKELVSRYFDVEDIMVK